MIQAGLGKYPAIFDYKIFQADGNQSCPIGFHVYCFLFWDSVPFMTVFHDPDCLCTECTKAQAHLNSLNTDKPLTINCAAL